MFPRTDSSARLALQAANTHLAAGIPQPAAVSLQSDERAQARRADVDVDHDTCATDLDPLSQFLPENQIVIDRSNVDAQALHHESGQLCETSAQPAGEYSLGRCDVVCDPADDSTDDRLPALGATELLTTLETRLASLTEEYQRLRESDHIVAELERRAAAAAAQLDQAAKARIELEHEFAHLQTQLKRVSRTARNDVKRLVDYQQRIEHGQSGPGLGPPVNSGASIVAMWNGARNVWQSSPQRGALVAWLGAAVLLGIIATGSLDRILPESARAASASVLVSRSLLVPIVAVPTPAPPNTPARNTRSATAPVRLPAVAGVRPRSTEDPGEGRQFIGALAIVSAPAGATVFVNQRPVGETPVRLTDLRAGSYVVRIERERYQRWTKAVNVPADRQTRVSATLQLERTR